MHCIVHDVIVMHSLLLQLSECLNVLSFKRMHYYSLSAASDHALHEHHILYMILSQLA